MQHQESQQQISVQASMHSVHLTQFCSNQYTRNNNLRYASTDNTGNAQAVVERTVKIEKQLQ